MNRKLPFISFMTFVLVASALYATEPAPVSEEITYKFEDFETFTPAFGGGRPEVLVASYPEKELVHSGKQALRMEWDFSRCPDGNGATAMAFFFRKLIGHPQAVRFWAYSDESIKGANLVLCMSDPSDEIYLQGIAVDWVGWKQVTIPVATGPAWPGGDKNGKLDLPASFRYLAVFYGGPMKGKLIVDDMEIVTSATPRDALKISIGSKEPMEHPLYFHNIDWHENADIKAYVQNLSSGTVSDLKFDMKVKNAYTGKMIFNSEVPVGTLAGKSETDKSVCSNVPYGLYEIEWTLFDNQGVIEKGTTEFTHMMPKCGNEGLSKEEQKYLMHDSPIGGLFWDATPQQSSDTGARWARYWVNWVDLEPKPGVYKMGLAQEAVKKITDAGIDYMWLATLYFQPEFHQPDTKGFAPAYGAFLKELTRTLKDSIYMYELSNEDNGPTKFMYTEAARHGAAGVRSIDPLALIANSGTAYCDIGWLRMQATRKLFDRLDALCVHPYVMNKSAEDFGVFEQAQMVVTLNDELGGMKHLWTTEWGWPETLDVHESERIAYIPQNTRAEYIVRHFMVGIAAGYEKHGLFSWAGHFGIYSGHKPFVSAVSVHAMAKILEGYRFAGILERSNDVWVVVWEKFGKPIIIAWSPAGKKTWSIDVGSSKVQMKDLFGNELPASVSNGKLTMELTSAPQYVLGGPEAITDLAWKNQLEYLRQRIPNHANRLRIAMQLARMGQASEQEKKLSVKTDQFLKKATDIMYAEQAKDNDLPALRWAVSVFKELDVEKRFAESENQKEFAQRLQTAEGILVDFAMSHFIGKDAQQFTAAWPYLYTLDKDGKLVEQLKFIHNIPTEIKVRVNNYAKNPYKARIALFFSSPGGKCEPQSQEVELVPGKNAETSFMVTCFGNMAAITAKLKIHGKPVVEIPFNDLKIVPK